MTKIVLNEITSPTQISVINNNFEKISQEFQNKALYRDNPTGEPNHMLDNLDMNGNRILNLPAPADPNEAARLQDVQASSD